MNETQDEQVVLDDGRVDAQGSVWIIHYQSRELDAREVARALAPLGVVKAELAVVSGASRITPNNN